MGSQSMETCALNPPLKRVRSKSWLGFDQVAVEPDWRKKVCLLPLEEAAVTLPQPAPYLAQ